jgi:hypothetical protein
MYKLTEREQIVNFCKGFTLRNEDVRTITAINKNEKKIELAGHV